MTPELTKRRGPPLAAAALPVIAIRHPEAHLRLTASLSGCWLARTAETTALERRGAAAQGACLRAVAAVSCMAAGGWALGWWGLCFRGVGRGSRLSQPVRSCADVQAGRDRAI